MAAAQPEVLAVTKALAVEQPMFAQPPHSAIELLSPLAAAVPEDSLVVPEVQPVASPATREPAVKVKEANRAHQLRVETADHQMAEAGEPVGDLVLAEPAEPAQPRAVVVAVADTTAEVAAAQTSMAAALTQVAVAEVHHGTTPHSPLPLFTPADIELVQVWP
jgi:SOS-response transcriptional repressor LexA